MRYRIGFIIFILLAPLTVHADFNNFYYDWSSFFSPLLDENAGLTLFPSLFIPMGGRYEGMGTAFTAVSNDGSFLESNPAGSAQLPYTELSLFHHNWIMDSNIEGVVYATRMNDFGLAGGAKMLYVPFNEKDEWGRAGGKGYYMEAIAMANASYNFLSSYYFDGISIGATLKGALMYIPASIYPNQSVITAMMDVGVLTRFNFLKLDNSHANNFSVGLTLRNLSPFDTGDPLPLTASAGIAYAPIHDLLFSFDFNYPISLDPENYPAENWYVSGGFSVAVASFISIQGGVRLKAANPQMSLGTEINLKTVTFVVNYNLDLASGIDPLDKFSIQAKFNLGDQGRAENLAKAEELYLQGLSAYTDGDYFKAIRLWEQALEVDQKYTPASEYIAITKETLGLQNNLEQINILPEEGPSE
jgi:tetratricopeptide (TPR) repeat protein